MATNKAYGVGIGLMAIEVEVPDVPLVSDETIMLIIGYLKRIDLRLPILIIKTMVSVGFIIVDLT